MTAMPMFSLGAPPSRGGREKHSIVSQLEGVLLISRSLFAYFVLIALEAGNPLRALALLVVFPIAWSFEFAGFQKLALQIMIFVSTVGLRADDMKAAAKATLARFFLEDLRESAYGVFSICGGKKYVITCCPRIMVEPFLKEYLDVDHVIGTELRMFKGYCLGVTISPGVIDGARTFEALLAVIGNDELVDVGLGGGPSYQPFMSLCKERYRIPPCEVASALPRRDYPRPLIFHDGRLVARPSPFNLLAVLLYLPLGVTLTILRILMGVLLPYKLGLLCSAATGLRTRAQFPKAQQSSVMHEPVGTPRKRGTLYVCNHRTLLDPVMVSTALQRKIVAVTYSLSRFSELISPIPTIRLTRDRFKDGTTMRSLLDHGDLIVCPEGTTCREPYLLRFSPLFAEIADDIVPVAVVAHGSMFYGTTVRGCKWLDSFFLLMNPSPCYQLEFLERVSGNCQSSCDVANGVQRSIGQAIGFKCTNLTRRDKYRMLAGHDGLDTRA